MYGREGTNNRSLRDLFRPTKAKHYTRTAVKPSSVQFLERNMHLGLNTLRVTLQRNNFMQA